MINIRKKKDVIAEMNEHTECAYSMMDSIAKMTAIDFDDSGAFGYDSPHTVLFCDLIFKLYSRAEYKEAMALMAVAFMMVGMDDSSHLMGVAASGYTEENGKYYLDRFFEYSGIIETYALGLQMYTGKEYADGEDDSDM